MSDLKKIVQHFVENEWRDRCPHTHGNAFSYCQPCTKINMDSSASIGEMKCQNKVKLAALLASQSTGWRPMESAPTEIGTGEWARPYILLLPKEGLARIGKWEDDRFARAPRPFWKYQGFTILDSRANPPTRWMPLPSVLMGGNL